MTERRALEVPRYLADRPRDKRGHIVPWFVAWPNGEPDFRTVDGPKIPQAIVHKKCWICGHTLGRYLAFPIGPMCVINRTISEPPSHRECAVYASQVCPFLTLPKAQRRDANLPDSISEPAGIGLSRNPGALCVWITKSYRLLRVSNGLLFKLGDPLECLWFAEGRAATREEVMASIESGLPLLEEVAQADGPTALEELARQHERALAYLP